MPGSDPPGDAEDLQRAIDPRVITLLALANDRSVVSVFSTMACLNIPQNVPSFSIPFLILDFSPIPPTHKKFPRNTLGYIHEYTNYK